MVAVPEGVGNQRRRALEGEFADGSVAGAEEVHAEVAEPVHDGVRMQVAAGEGAREHPRAVGSGAGTKIGTRGEMLPNERRERFGNVSRVRPSLMLMPVSLSSTMLVWKVTTLTSGWA